MTKKSRKATRVGATTGLSLLDFARKCIARNTAKTGYKGLHTVYGMVDAGGVSFNKVVSTEFGVDVPTVVLATKKLVAQGKLVSIPAKGGVRLYLPESAPAASATPPSAERMANLLADIGGS